MEKQIEAISKSNRVHYIKECPVVLFSNTIMKDNVKKRLLAQPVFCNIGTENVKEIYLQIRCADVHGNELQGIENFVYEKLDHKQGTLFGQETAIYLPDPRTAYIKFSVKLVSFTKGNVWMNLESEWYAPVMAQEKLKTPDEKGHKFVPVRTADYWLCSCGAFNEKHNEECFNCNEEINNIFIQ